MRRSDREVIGLSNILDILDRCEIIRIGLCVDNKPYIVPMNFAYEIIGEKVNIYLHCAKAGRKLDMISINNNVCFEADCEYKIIKREKACEWSAKYQSVIGESKIEILSSAEQKVAGMDLLMKRYGFEGKPEYGEKELMAVTVLKITVHSLTGKRN